MGEREEHIATGRNLSPEEELLPLHGGRKQGHGDESEGTSPSRQGAGTGILVPRSLLAMAAKIGIASGKSTSILGISSTRAKYRPKEGARGAAGQPGGQVARPRVDPRRAPSWAPGGDPPAMSWLFQKLPGR